MPTLNDLTPEEEAEFTRMGEAPAGPGGEPISEDQGSDPVEQGQPAEEPNGDPAPDPRVRTPDGKFATPLDPNAPVDPDAPPQQPRMVPHEALHQERQRAAEAIRQSQLAMTRMNALLANQQQQQNVPPPLPDLENDPVGYIRQMEARLEQFETARREETQFREIDNAIDQDERLFAQNVPDYNNATDHYVQSRAAELMAFNSPQDAQRIMVEEARQIAQQAWQRGMPAAQMIYQLAQARGYRPQQQDNQQQFQPQGQPQQQQRGPAPADVVRGVRNAQQASRSLSGGGGGGNTAQLNAEAILNMSDEEFENHLKLGTKGANARFAAIG